MSIPLLIVIGYGPSKKKHRPHFISHARKKKPQPITQLTGNKNKQRLQMSKSGMTTRALRMTNDVCLSV